MQKIKWVHWPTLQNEMKPFLDILHGHVLNAGSGVRSIQFPNVYQWTNIDIKQYPGVDIVADLEHIPCAANSFEGILNIAVLEHCQRPWKVVEEFHRVLKKGGVLLGVMPFMQPIHNFPSDYHRMTPAGIKTILEDAGFTVTTIHKTHSVFHVIGWFAEEIVKYFPAWMQYSLLPLAKINYLLSKYFAQTKVSEMPSAITFIAKK